MGKANEKLQFLRVRGKKIVNEKGRPLKLKGVNLGGWLMMEGYILGGRNIPQREFIKRLRRKLGREEADRFIWNFRDSFITQEDAKNLQALGCNCVRIPFHYRLIEGAPYKYSEEGLRYLDRVLSWFERYNIYCILDLHAAPGCQNRDWHSDSYGEALLWKRKGYQDRCVALWGKLANRYRERRCIAGYDLLNEPVTENIGILNRLYRRITEAIRSNDENHIIFLEGNRWAQKLDVLLPPFDPNTAYSTHFYAPVDFTFDLRPGLVYPGKIGGQSWNKKKIRELLKPYIAFRNKYHVPIYVGEFGVTSRCPACRSELRWVGDTLSVFNELDFHWTYWTYKVVPGNVFPDGIYQLLENTEWVARGELVKGWENFWALSKAGRKKALKALKTKNFEELEELSSLLMSS